MTFLKQKLNWFFAPQSVPITELNIVRWWESRRMLYNLIIATFGIPCLFAFYWAINSSGHLEPGDDAVEPMALIATPFVANICYTLGWFVQIILRRTESPVFAQRLLRFGLGFSLFVIGFPTICWLVFRLLQLVNVLK
jgi:hypothetical protein